MEVKVRKIGNGYGILLPKQLMDEMQVEENSTLNVVKVDGVYQLTPFDPEFAQALKAFRESEPRHRNTYMELAK